MMVFDSNELKHFENTWVWSTKHTDILSDCNVVFKSSGQTKYLALRVKAMGENYGNASLIDDIIEQEYERVFSDKHLLEFRILKQLWRKGVDVVKHLGSKIQEFVKSVAKRVGALVMEVASGGFDALLGFFGLEISGTAILKTPSW
jgi:hypothetical protein